MVGRVRGGRKGGVKSEGRTGEDYVERWRGGNDSGREGREA